MFKPRSHSKTTLKATIGVGIAGAGLVLAGCTSAPAPTTPVAGDTQTQATGAAAVVEQATQKTTEAGSARFSGSITGAGLPAGVGGTSEDATMKMEGAYDFNGRKMEATAALGVLGQNAEIRIISVDGKTYMQMPQLGDKWLQADVSDLGMTDAFSSPEEAFAQLKNVADLQESGPDTVDGVQTTKYTGTIDLNAVLAESGVTQEDLQGEKVDGKAEVTIWIDGEGRVVKMTTTTKATVGKQDVSSEAVMRFYDFGADLEITPPPPGDVTDLSDMSKIPGKADLSELQAG